MVEWQKYTAIRVRCSRSVGRIVRTLQKNVFQFAFFYVAKIYRTNIETTVRHGCYLYLEYIYVFKSLYRLIYRRAISTTFWPKFLEVVFIGALLYVTPTQRFKLQPNAEIVAAFIEGNPFCSGRDAKMIFMSHASRLWLGMEQWDLDQNKIIFDIGL